MEQYVKNHFELDSVQSASIENFSIKSQVWFGEIDSKHYEVKFLYVDDVLTGVIFNDKKISPKKFEKKMNKLLSKNL